MKLRRILSIIKRKLLLEYYRFNNKHKAIVLRKKSTSINFVFILYDLSTWKTEKLYQEMLQHPRFNPILAVTTNKNLIGHEKCLINYLIENKYSFVRLDENKTISEQIPADILMYQRPYNEEPEKHQYSRNRGILMVHLLYGFHSLTEKWSVDLPMAMESWQDYYENELCADGVRQHAKNRGRNAVVTGTPMMDELAKDKSEFENPWKNNDARKRIIWAPHHTIGDIHMSGIAYGTFLEIAEDMVSLAKDYKDQIYIAFKPHPVLYRNLLKVWGEEKTNAYYKEWEKMENTQIETGAYTSLFKYSDAMIHDCGGFTMEYLTTGNPVMYVVRNERQSDNVNECAKQSFDLHYHGQNIGDIRSFIDKVITGEDPRKEERNQFVKRYLRPPHGKSACQNIINAILGVEEYK